MLTTLALPWIMCFFPVLMLLLPPYLFACYARGWQLSRSKILLGALLLAGLISSFILGVHVFWGFHQLPDSLGGSEAERQIPWGYIGDWLPYALFGFVVFLVSAVVTGSFFDFRKPIERS